MKQYHLKFQFKNYHWKFCFQTVWAMHVLIPFEDITKTDLIRFQFKNLHRKFCFSNRMDYTCSHTVCGHRENRRGYRKTGDVRPADQRTTAEDRQDKLTNWQRWQRGQRQIVDWPLWSRRRRLWPWRHRCHPAVWRTSGFVRSPWSCALDLWRWSGWTETGTSLVSSCRAPVDFSLIAAKRVVKVRRDIYSDEVSLTTASFVIFVVFIIAITLTVLSTLVIYVTLIILM